MEVTLLFIFIIFTFLLLFIYKHSNYQWNKSNSQPPGPRGLPIIGNMHQFDTSNTHLYLLQLSQKYGPIISLQLGSVRTVVISSATVVKEVFKNHDLVFSSRPTLVGLQKLSYNYLDFGLAPYSDYWRNMRKICTLHLFSTKSFQSFCPIREDEVAKMMKKLSNRVAASADFNIVNVSKLVMTVTSSIVYRTSFGKIYDDDDEDDTGYNNKMSRQIHWVLAESQDCFGRFFVEDFFPQMGSFIDKLCGSWTRLEKSFNKIDAFYQEVIDNRLLASTVSTKECCILDILLQMKMDTSEFTFDNIKAVVMDIMLAASETSAAAVIWAMSLLVKNPTKMKKVQQEVRELIGKKGFVDENDTQQLDYLKSVVKEALRLHPPVPVVPRATMKKCVVSGYDIEDKTRVYLNLYAIGRDPEFWENPDEFISERFLNSSIDIKGQDFELLPFGVGRRMCPGLTTGMAMTQLALANLLYHFNWELPPSVEIADIDMDTLPGLTTQKKNDLCLVPIVNI